MMNFFKNRHKKQKKGAQSAAPSGIGRPPKTEKRFIVKNLNPSVPGAVFSAALDEGLPGFTEDARAFIYLPADEIEPDGMFEGAKQGQILHRMESGSLHYMADAEMLEEGLIFFVPDRPTLRGLQEFSVLSAYCFPVYSFDSADYRRAEDTGESCTAGELLRMLDGADIPWFKEDAYEDEDPEDFAALYASYSQEEEAPFQQAVYADPALPEGLEAAAQQAYADENTTDEVMMNPYSEQGSTAVLGGAAPAGQTLPPVARSMQAEPSRTDPSELLPDALYTREIALPYDEGEFDRLFGSVFVSEPILLQEGETYLRPAVEAANAQLAQMASSARAKIRAFWAGGMKEAQTAARAAVSLADDTDFGREIRIYEKQRRDVNAKLRRDAEDRKQALEDEYAARREACADRARDEAAAAFDLREYAALRAGKLRIDEDAQRGADREYRDLMKALSDRRAREAARIYAEKTASLAAECSALVEKSTNEMQQVREKLMRDLKTAYEDERAYAASGKSTQDAASRIKERYEAMLAQQRSEYEAQIARLTQKAQAEISAAQNEINSMRLQIGNVEASAKQKLSELQDDGQAVRADRSRKMDEAKRRIASAEAQAKAERAGRLDAEARAQSAKRSRAVLLTVMFALCFILMLAGFFAGRALASDSAGADTLTERTQVIYETQTESRLE